jgi:hypothetical protein
MENKLTKKLDDNLTKFNSLNYNDKAFTRSIVIGDLSKVEIVRKIYGIEDDVEADIKAMTSLAKPEIQGAIAELNKIQMSLMKAKMLNMSDEAFDEMQNIMRNGIEESNRLKAASTISKIGIDLVKEEEKKNPNVAMKIIIENPSGDININFGADKVMESFGNIETVEEVKEEKIIEGEFEEVKEDKPKHKDEVEMKF